MPTLRVETNRWTPLVDVTAQVEKAVASSGVTNGTCCLSASHTTAAITVNERADPDVACDVEGALDRPVLKTGAYRHSEGNSASIGGSVERGMRAGVC